MLPRLFCWTRFGTEAGQPIQDILGRKERERTANGGLFFWGIGNAIGPSMIELLRRTDAPEALFSPIKSAPRSADTRPALVAAWTRAEDLTGDPYDLPFHTLITSRIDLNNPRDTHYALVCRSTNELSVDTTDASIDMAGLRNLLTGRPVGASQVTAVVKITSKLQSPGNCYKIGFRAQLTPPYLVRLRNPIPIPRPANETSWTTAVERTCTELGLGTI